MSMTGRGANKPRNGPDFICIGAQKAGTSWLYNMLAGHPGVVMPPVKELHFFDEAESSLSSNLATRLRNLNDDRNRRWRRIAKLSLPKALLFGQFRRVNWLVNYLCSPRTLDSKGFSAYDSFFSTVPSMRLTGDVTPYYALLHPDTVASIRSRYPHLKIIYLLRDPIDRAMSALRMFVRDNGLETAAELGEDYILSVTRKNQHAHYAENLDKWLQHYPREQIHIDLFDCIKAEPAELMGRICHFLKLPPFSYNSSSLSKIINASSEIVISEDDMRTLRAECAREADELLPILSSEPHIDMSIVERWFEIRA